MKKINLLLIAILVFVFASCEKEDSISDTTKEFNRFIYYNMLDYYYWTDEIPDVDPDEQTDSEEFFYSLLYSDIDQWSYVTDDYQGLVDYFNGISEEFGYSVRPYLWEEGSDKVVAFVEYIEPNTPAEEAGLKRGDLIISVDGEELTTDNYTDLYYNTSITLGLGYIQNNTLYDASTSISIDAEVISVDPILKTNVFTMGNGVKVGYLAYTAFIADYNEDLEQVFSDFKAEGVTELILDLRYNGGGSVATANLMASMIGPSTLKDQVFVYYDYNQYITEYYEENYADDESYFVNRFVGSDYCLDLSRVFVLTTSSTASASEMVMYSLMPYIDVIQIGEQTTGKYYASVSIYDEEKNWAIQPLILRAENEDSSIDYSQGLIPDVETYDDYSYELGSEDEVLTSIALDQIYSTISTSSALKKARSTIGNLSSMKKKTKHPLDEDMYITIEK